jgi:hypothetical protein
MDEIREAIRAMMAEEYALQEGHTARSVAANRAVIFITWLGAAACLLLLCLTQGMVREDTPEHSRRSHPRGISSSSMPDDRAPSRRSAFPPSEVLDRPALRASNATDTMTCISRGLAPSRGTLPLDAVLFARRDPRPGRASGAIVVAA